MRGRKASLEKVVLQMEEDIFPKKVLHHKMEGRAKPILEVLEKDCRASLKQIVAATKIPSSTVFRILEEIKKYHDFRFEMIPTSNKIHGTVDLKRTMQRIIKCLEENPRMKLTEMSRRTRIPVSTLFDNMNRLKEGYQLKLRLEKR